MKRILIVSDSHGYDSTLSTIFWHAESIGKLDGVLHLGDGYRDMQPYLGMYPHVLQVGGNCDFLIDEREHFVTCFGVPMLMTHGHFDHVKYGYDDLADRAKAMGAKIALFGHTHQGFFGEHHGILMMNPGAACDGHFGMLTVSDKGEIHGQLY